MPRDIPGQSLQELLKQETSVAFFILLTITDQEGFPYYFTNDSVDTVTSEATFQHMPFDIVLPDNVDGRSQVGQLTLENVSRDLIDDLRLHTIPMTVDIQVVLSSDPNEVLAKYPTLKMRQLTYNATTLSGQLTMDDYLNEMVGVLMTGTRFGGLFYI